MAKNTVIVSITSNISGLKKGVDQAGGALGGLGKVAGVAAAAVGVAAVAIGTKAVKAASSLEQNMGALESVFKGNAAQMTTWARGAASSVGLAQSEYAGLATTIGSQLKNMGVSTDAVAGQTNDLVKMGADLAAQFGGSTSDAVGALSSLLRGERDPIERYGVSINEAAVKAKMAEMGLSGLSGEAEKNAKLQATLALLTQQTADAQGAFARESTTLAGAQQRLGAGLENVYAALGTSMLPAVTAVTAAFGELVNRFAESEWFADLRDNLLAGSEAFADFVFGILNGEKSLGDIDIAGFITRAIPKMFAASDQMRVTLINALPRIAEGIAAALPGIIQTLATAITTSFTLILTTLVGLAPTLLQSAITLFMSLVNSVLLVLPELITAVLDAIPQVVTALTEMVPILLEGAMTLFRALIDAVILILPDLLTQIADMLPSLVESVLGMIPQILDAAVELFTMLVDSIPIILPILVQTITDILPKLVQTIIKMLPQILNAAINLFTALVQSLPIILPTLLTGIINLLPSIITSVISMIPALIQGAFQLFTALVLAIPKIIPQLIPALIGLIPIMVTTLIDLIPKLIQAGVDLIGGLVQGLFNAAADIGNALLKIAQDAIGDFLSFLGINSPSRLFRGFGENVGQGLAIGIDKSGRVVSNALDDMSAMVADTDLSLGSMSTSVRAYGDTRSPAKTGGDVINITLSTLNATAETGRIIVQSIEDYKLSGGRLA